MSSNEKFDTNVLFSGGAGMFLQYHDVIKPAYLYAIISMILTNRTYGIPVEIIKNFSVLSILEWYINRRYKNPLKQLDFLETTNIDVLDDLLYTIMSNDSSIYTLSPALNINRMLYVYRKQHMTFPIYVYSEKHEPLIQMDCEQLFEGIQCKYLYGDLDTAIKNCDQNFTYIFSDIELVKNACEILTGSCSHVLLASDYRYNYIDNHRTFKYDLKEMMLQHPFVRIGTTLTMDMQSVCNSLAEISTMYQGES